VVKLLWLAITCIEDKRAREREARRARDQQTVRPARTPPLCWREALNELDDKAHRIYWC
jgi:hypothetical protein